MKSNASTFAVLLLIVSVLLYAVALNPMMASLNKERRHLETEQARLTTMEGFINSRTEMDKKIGELKVSAEKRSQALITPLLNSYAMRARAWLDTIAREAGLEDVEYTEGELRTLPIPPLRLPTARTARRSVQLTVNGDYAAIVSFILRVERGFPLVVLQSLSIEPGARDSAEIQKARLTLEWPCEGEVIK